MNGRSSCAQHYPVQNWHSVQIFGGSTQVMSYPGNLSCRHFYCWQTWAEILWKFPLRSIPFHYKTVQLFFLCIIFFGGWKSNLTYGHRRNVYSSLTILGEFVIFSQKIDSRVHPTLTELLWPLHVWRCSDFHSVTTSYYYYVLLLLFFNPQWVILIQEKN